MTKSLLPKCVFMFSVFLLETNSVEGFLPMEGHVLK